LRSERAIAVNIAVMRAFVHLRELVITHKDLARRIDDLERRYEGQFTAIFDAIKQLITAHHVAAKPRRAIGFRGDS
jgi:hypothetical protein